MFLLIKRFVLIVLCGMFPLSAMELQSKRPCNGLSGFKQDHRTFNPCSLRYIAAQCLAKKVPTIKSVYKYLPQELQSYLNLFVDSLPVQSEVLLQSVVDDYLRVVSCHKAIVEGFSVNVVEDFCTDGLDVAMKIGEINHLIDAVKVAEPNLVQTIVSYILDFFRRNKISPSMLKVPTIKNFSEYLQQAESVTLCNEGKPLYTVTMTALDYGFKSENPEVLEKLFACGAAIKDLKSPYYALKYAFRAHDEDLIGSVVDFYRRNNNSNLWGESILAQSLNIAALENNSALIMFLIQLRISSTMWTQSLASRNIATRCKHYEALLALNFGEFLVKILGDDFILSPSVTVTEIIQTLIVQGKVNKQSAEGDSLLNAVLMKYHSFLSEGKEIADAYLNTIRMLLEQGANVNQINKFGESPLMACYAADSLSEMLLAYHADVNFRKASNNESIFFKACRGGNFEKIRFLMSKGASLNLQNKKGRNPLHLVVRDRFFNLEILEFLIDYCDSEVINQVDKHGKTVKQYLIEWMELCNKKRESYKDCDTNVTCSGLSDKDQDSEFYQQRYRSFDAKYQKSYALLTKLDCLSNGNVSEVL